MNIYLIIILAIIIGEYLLNLIVETLNMGHASPVLPGEFVGYFDQGRYRRAQDYLREKTLFEICRNTVMTSATLLFILIGGFNAVDNLARSLDQNYIITGLIFSGILSVVIQVLNVPFSAYNTFAIESKYGFNKTTPATFILDFLKKLFIGAVIGAVMFSSVLWFFQKMDKTAWIYCWAAVTLFQIFLSFVAPVLIMPMFNKFIPLEPGTLKDAIERYAASQEFKIGGIFKMDASRRSSKSNAFFTGFGKFRRIALFDTLIEKQTVDELVSVLAHEVGHYKKKHVIKNLLFYFCTNGLMFFILSFFINNKGLFAAVRMESTSIYGSLILFSLLYSPISIVLFTFNKFLYRRYEYQADEYAVKSYGRHEAFITALKKLTVDNLSNLTPHPFKVFMEYSHPPVLERIRAIRISMHERGVV